MFRQIQATIESALAEKNHQIILILGLRQTGKSTLARQIVQGRQLKIFNFDLASDRDEFVRQNRHSLAEFARVHRDTIILVDEVQKVIGATNVIKHLYDNYKLHFILTGSSELKITKQLGDSLAGRVRRFKLYPLSLREILVQRGAGEAQSVLSQYLVFGSLPAMENLASDERQNFLVNFIETLLSKDILELMDTRKSTKIIAVAKLLAMQIGQLVNVNELANLTELSRASIYNYLDILEQMNIICRAYPLSINERQAISEKFKVYFTDLGLRNALVNNFNSLVSRLDGGALLENAVYMGLKRQLDYARKVYRLGFFRSQTGSEIDIVLQVDGKERLIEVKSAKKYSRKKGKVEYVTQENAVSLIS